MESFICKNNRVCVEKKCLNNTHHNLKGLPRDGVMYLLPWVSPYIYNTHLLQLFMYLFLNFLRKINNSSRPQLCCVLFLANIKHIEDWAEAGYRSCYEAVVLWRGSRRLRAPRGEMWEKNSRSLQEMAPADRKSFRCCILRTLLPLLTLKPSILSDLL